MALLKMREIREMSREERLDKLQTMIKAGGAVENPGRVRALKRSIARILTSLNEEEG